MNELIPPLQWDRLRPFFSGMADVMIRSVLEGHGGRCLVSDGGRSCLVIARGFLFFGGQADGAFLREAEAAFPSCFLTAAGTAEWLSILAGIGFLPTTRYEMTAPAAFDWDFLRQLAQPPAGYEIRIGQRGDYAPCLAQPWSEDLAGWYEDADAFAADGLTALIFREGRLAAGCGIYARTADAAEIEIDTCPDERRRGLALCCGAKFLLQCREKGLLPHWDAMTKISVRLAQRLGFFAPRPYPAVYRE